MTKSKTQIVTIPIKMTRDQYTEMLKRKGEMTWAQWFFRDDLDEVALIINSGGKQ